MLGIPFWGGFVYGSMWKRVERVFLRELARATYSRDDIKSLVR